MQRNNTIAEFLSIYSNMRVQLRELEINGADANVNNDNPINMDDLMIRINTFVNEHIVNFLDINVVSLYGFNDIVYIDPLERIPNLNFLNVFNNHVDLSCIHTLVNLRMFQSACNITDVNMDFLMRAKRDNIFHCIIGGRIIN